ncbi:MAG: chitobiase/beta-hexosaminidase C-terminal domain-containing protein [Muribaculaceae bacterium]
MKHFLLLVLAAIIGFSANADSYKLVTSADDLTIGSRYLVVGYKSDVAYALGAQNPNNRAAVEVAVADGVVAIAEEAVSPLTLVASGDESFPYAFQDGEQYLHAASTSSNYLKLTDDLTTDAAHATIEIAADGVATIKFNQTSKNWLRKNSTNDLFSCYGSGQNDVYLYKEESAAPQIPAVYWNNAYSNWDAVYAYAWNDEGNNADWPGVQISDPDADGIFEYQTEGAWNFIIFNNNNGTQTGNLAYEVGKVYDSREPLPEQVYMMGHIEGAAQWDPAVGHLMTSIGNGVYEIDDVVIANADNGYGYICVTTALGDWNTVNSNRYGPENNNELLALGDVASAVKASNSWKIAVGAYKFTYDFYNATITVSAPTTKFLNNLGEAADLVDGDKVALKSPVVAVAQLGKNLWVQDDYNFMLVYGETGQTYSNGDVIPAGFSGTYTIYNGLPEFGTPAGFQASESNSGAIAPNEIATTDLAEMPLNCYVELTGTVEGSGRSYTITDAKGSAAIYTSSSSFAVETGENVTVRGFTSIFVKNGETTYQITPVESFSSTLPVAETPVMSLGSQCRVLKGTKLVITTATEGATIHYTIDGSEPTNVSTVYSEPIILLHNCVVKAIAVLDGYRDSEVAVCNVTIAEVPDNLYLIGDIKDHVWNPADPVGQMTLISDAVFEISNVEIIDSNNGYGYFAFTSALGDWDTVNANRFGPDASDEPVAAGDTFAYVSSGYSWMILAGVYNFQVDILNQTVTVTEGQTSGVDVIEANDNAPAEYYTIGGVKVANPDKGIYIVRRNGKYSKEIIR